jgi:hypothetical protein
MKKILVSLLFFIATSFVFKSHGQSQFTGWLASFSSFKIGKKTSIHADVQFRSSDEFKHMQTLLLRPGLNVHINKRLTLTGGYAFIQNRRTINSVSGYAPEHRIWEQLLYNHKLKNIFVSHRFRLEQRFISKSAVVNNELENEEFLHANRLRYFIRNILPLQKQQNAFAKGVFAAVQNEVFANIGNTANVNGKFFDQNRLYLAIGYRVNASCDIETGYLNQYNSGRNNTHVTNHVWQVAGYVRL